MEFREFRDQFVAMDGFLNEGGLESAFLQAAAAEHAKTTLANASAQVAQSFARTTALALRSNVARVLTGLSYRACSVRRMKNSSPSATSKAVCARAIRRS